MYINNHTQDELGSAGLSISQDDYIAFDHFI